MTWTVIWTEEAQSQLADIWLRVLNREEITIISRKIDLELREHPLEVGEERDLPERILLIKPLAVLYDVIEADRLVTVYAVWLW
jgi:hypothetical protein